MVAFSRQSLIRHIPAGGGIAIGVFTAGACLLMPVATLESLVADSGIAALVPVAAPPLGATARAVLAFGLGGLAAAIVWSALFLLFGPGGWLHIAQRRDDGVPVIRRADAHPDAPARRPMSASDLGTPMMEVPVPERPLPQNLDVPLSDFDPGALLPVPMSPVRPVPSLVAAPLPIVAQSDPTEDAPRITTFELKPNIRPVPEAIEPAPERAPSIDALLRRLEQGAGRRSHAV